MTKSIRASIYAAVVLAAIFLAACAAPKEAVAPATEVVRDVPVSEVRLTTMPDVVEAVGTVRAAETAPLAAQIMGTVTAVAVREGDPVKPGQVLAVIDQAQSRAALQRAEAAVNGAGHQTVAAEADYTLATATLKRYQELFDQKAVSPQEFDEVNARAQQAAAKRELARSGEQQAKAGLEEARTALDHTRVRAPFAGLVTEKRIEVGAMAVPGMPLFTVEGSGRFRLEASVDEDKLRLIRLGETVPVQLDALDRELQGKVAQIVPAADPASRSFIVKVELPADNELHSGLFGRAFFASGERQTLLVPRGAVLERGQLQGVYVLGADRVAALRYVTLGKASGEQVEVLSGLEPGDALVTAPGTRDLAGKRIQ